MANPCPTCLPLDCFAADDTDLYSIEGPIYPFVFECPPGYDCSNAETFNMVCCGQLLSTTLPPTATQQEKQELIQVVVNQCDVRLLYCGGITPTTPIILYYNRPKKCVVLCPDGTEFTFSVPAGSFAATTQAQADLNAEQYACVQAGLRQVCLGTIQSVACVGTAYSATIPRSGGIPPYVFSLVSGALPSGLSLNASGTISGTPTTVQDSTFTVRCSTGTGAHIDKAYEINVSSCTTILLSITPTSWNPGDTINYIGLAPTLPGDLFQINFTGSNWDGRGSSISGHFNDVGGQFDGSGNATMVSLKLMRSIFTGGNGLKYWGAGPCTLRIEDTDQSPSVFSNTLNRTVVRHAAVSIDGTALAYILAHPDLLEPYTPTGTLTEEFYGLPTPTAQYEDTGTAVGAVNQTIGAPKGILYSPNNVDLVIAYLVAQGGGHAMLTYQKLATAISNPTGVYTLLNDPNGDAPATCTIT